MGNALRDKTVVVVGRDQAKLANAYSGGDAEVVDVTDDDSIAPLADRVGLDSLGEDRKGDYFKHIAEHIAERQTRS